MSANSSIDADRFALGTERPIVVRSSDDPLDNPMPRRSSASAMAIESRVVVPSRSMLSVRFCVPSLPGASGRDAGVEADHRLRDRHGVAIGIDQFDPVLQPRMLDLGEHQIGNRADRGQGTARPFHFAGSGAVTTLAGGVDST